MIARVRNTVSHPLCHCAFIVCPASLLSSVLSFFIHDHDPRLIHSSPWLFAFYGFPLSSHRLPAVLLFLVSLSTLSFFVSIPFLILFFVSLLFFFPQLVRGSLNPLSLYPQQQQSQDQERRIAEDIPAAVADDDADAHVDEEEEKVEDTEVFHQQQQNDNNNNGEDDDDKNAIVSSWIQQFVSS